uniref:Tc1-like transposase DDE domain-containing protein n=1 Tax=Magallana gigas TaxID=29159 RepID=A0A8W8HNJ4_MAGGI
MYEFTTRKKSIAFLPLLVGMVNCATISQERNTFPWFPQGWSGYVLYCSNACKNVPLIGNKLDSCCACHSKSVWDFSGTVSHLNVSNDGYLEGNKSARNIHVNFVKENLQFLPKNICHFPGITKINLAFNLITDIPNLSCIQNLTDLNLSYNKLSSLPKSLTHNRNLRTVDLSGNYITRLETGVLAALSAHNILLKGNQIMSIDITDVVFERPFCVINMSHNALRIPTNENNWKVSLKAKYGPGYAVFSFNFFTRMPNATKLGFSNIFDLSKLFDFGFDFRYNPIICDCNIAKLLLRFKDYIDVMKRDYFDLTCGSPEQFKDKSLPSIIMENQIKDLLCNYTSTPLCPAGCTCEESPKHIDYRSKSLTLTLIINCSGAGVKRLPRVLPYSDRIEFHMRGNMIYEIPNNHYLNHVSVLDLEMMPVFDKDALDNLIRLQIFSVPESEQRKGISRSLSRLSPCVFLQKTDFVMVCTCSHLWMLDWIDEDCVVYISYDVNVAKIGPWVFKTLEPFLFGSGLSAFVPSRDLSLGSVRAEEAAYHISVSRYYLVILSEGWQTTSLEIKGERYADYCSITFLSTTDLEEARPIAGAVGEVFIFIDDNARFHRARIVNETFESKTIQRMNRPSLSPDLNPIEHDWNILQQRNALQHLPALPQNQQEPPNALQEEWQQIPQASLAWIMGSIGRRCWAVTA